MNAIFRKYPDCVLVIDLRAEFDVEESSAIVEKIQTHKPVKHLVWIVPSAVWASNPKAFVHLLQSARKQTQTGGPLGPTSVVCSEYMALDWVGPVRALAIALYGKDAEIEYQIDGMVNSSPLLTDLHTVHPDATFVRINGRRPKVDLF